jgi:hypothetical protein
MRRRKDSRTRDKVAPRHLADPRQAALLLLRDIELRDHDREHAMTRVQLTAPMLRRLWKRPLLSPEFLEQVSAWLAVAGWCFFNAGATYAAVRMSAVKNWPRLGTKRIAESLDQVAMGDFPFEEHEYLLTQGEERERKHVGPSDTADSEDKEANDEE